MAKLTKNALMMIEPKSKTKEPAVNDKIEFCAGKKTPVAAKPKEAIMTKTELLKTLKALNIDKMLKAKLSNVIKSIGESDE